MEKNNQTVVST